VRVRLATLRDPATPITLTARDANSNQLAQTTLIMPPYPDTTDRFPDARAFTGGAEFTIPAASLGVTYTLLIRGDNMEIPMARVLADAQIVHQTQPGQWVVFRQNAGRYFAGARVFTRTTQPNVTIENAAGLPFSIRDAATGELLYRSKMTDPPEITLDLVSAERLIFFTVSGLTYSRYCEMKFVDGLSPYLAATAEGWFEP
jgi:hypothetical protein